MEPIVKRRTSLALREYKTQRLAKEVARERGGTQGAGYRYILFKRAITQSARFNVEETWYFVSFNPHYAAFG